MLEVKIIYLGTFFLASVSKVMAVREVVEGAFVFYLMLLGKVEWLSTWLVLKV